jgi:hypothetical protein
MSLLNVNDKAYYGQSRTHRHSTKQYYRKMFAAGPRTESASSLHRQRAQQFLSFGHHSDLLVAVTTSSF